MQLLKDCIGGSACSLLVATVSPELSDLEETANTLTFAQKMSQSGSVSSTRGDQDQSSLMQMRERHNQMIQGLKEKVSDSREEEIQDRKRLEQEMADINSKVLTKDSAAKWMDEIQQDQFGKFNEIRSEMTQVMGHQMDLLRKQSQEEMAHLKESMRQSNEDTEKAKKELEANEVVLSKLQAQLQSSQDSLNASQQEAINLKQELKANREASRSSNVEAATLKVQLAAAEERASLLQARQEELRKDRQDLDDERKDLRQQGETQWRRLAVVEAELAKSKSDAEVQRTELSRTNTARAEESEAVRKDREHWRISERELRDEARELQKRADDIRRDSELQALKQENLHREDVAKLKLQIERLEVEARNRVEQVAEAQKQVGSLEAERVLAQHREIETRQQADADRKRCQEELQDARDREEELTRMLIQVQDNIISESA